MHPGEYILGDRRDRVERRTPATARVVVRNTGDRPIQVGSHYHFFEVNNGADIRSQSGLWHAAGYCRRHCDSI